MSGLITVPELDALLLSDASVRILDVRWRLDRPEGRPEYVAAHLPGAVYVDLEAELAQRGHPRDGRHPLPDTQRLQRAVRRWGLRQDDTVVIYDDVFGVAASRAWWVLRLAGLPDVRVLDGGLRAWTEAGGELHAGDVAPRPSDIDLVPYDVDRLIDLDTAAAWPEHGILLDVRAVDRYRGERETHDPVAGHIPGARNLPISSLWRTDGRLADVGSLDTVFRAAGVAADTDVAVYCGSGVTSAHAAFALSLTGRDPFVYVGSWSQWSNTRGLPVAVGLTPSGAISPQLT